MDAVKLTDGQIAEMRDHVEARAKERPRGRLVVCNSTAVYWMAVELLEIRRAARLALPILERDRLSLVECSSTLVAADGGFEPVPGTLDPEAVDDVAAYDEAIAALRALTEPGP